MSKVVAALSVMILSLGVFAFFDFGQDQTALPHLAEGSCVTYVGMQKNVQFSYEPFKMELCTTDDIHVDGKFYLFGQEGEGLISVTEMSGHISEQTFIDDELVSTKVSVYDTNVLSGREDVLFADYDILLESSGLMSGAVIADSGHVGNVVGYQEIELLVDFNDDVSVAAIETLERKIEDENGGFDFELVPNSHMFSHTKITTLKVLAPYYFSVRDILVDFDSIEALENNRTFILDTQMQNVENTVHVSSSEGFPNDPLYEKQWHMNMVGMPDVWKQGVDGDGVIVAVVDTGVSDGRGRLARVPDLAQTEFVKGYNFVDDNADPSDGNSHGTHVAGTVAQSTNNGVGVAGMAPKAKIMPVKVLSDRGWGKLSDIVEGIRFAADNGANVINLSLGGGPFSPSMDLAVSYARNKKNVFMACAAGNGSTDVIEYPAAYKHCNAVSSVGKGGQMAFYSSHGKGRNGTSLFIAAPGGDQKADGPEGGVWQNTIVSGDPSKHGYFPFQGTSMATPHVAGAAALVIGVLGVEDYDVEDVEEMLIDTADSKGDSYRYGAGLLNVSAAIETAKDEKDDVPFVVGLLLLLSSIATVVSYRAFKR